MKKALKFGLLCFCQLILLYLWIGTKARAAEYKFNMSYIFFSNASDYVGMVDARRIS